MIKPVIVYRDFDKLDLRVGTIVAVEEIAGSEKLVKFLVDLGELDKKTILAGVKKLLSWQNLVGTQVLVLVNLEPKRMMGWESQGMILMAVEKFKVPQPRQAKRGRQSAKLKVNEVQEKVTLPQYQSRLNRDGTGFRLGNSEEATGFSPWRLTDPSK